MVIPAAIGIAVLASCKSGSARVAKKDSTAMPYKASYISSWVLCDSDKYAQEVLQSLKDWEDNKISNGTAYYGDTVAFDLWSRAKYNLKRDSMLKVFEKYRDSIGAVNIEVHAGSNLHSTDRNEDWVGVWYMEKDTYKNGKVDPAFYHDDNLIKNGKIVYTMDPRRTLPKAK